MLISDIGGMYMIYELLAASITLNVMFFTVIYLDSKDRKERIKTFK